MYGFGPFILSQSDFAILEKNSRYNYLRQVMYFMCATIEEQTEWRNLLRPFVLSGLEKEAIKRLDENKRRINEFRLEAIDARKYTWSIQRAHTCELKADALEQMTNEQLSRNYIQFSFHGY